MTGPVPLDNVSHADLRVRLQRGAAYGDAVNQVTVFPTEFEDLQREYPILLRRTAEGGWRAVVLLGLDPAENLFLDGDRWDARYIPALLARGPFSIGVPPAGEEGEPGIQVDPSHPRIADDGERVFLEHGGHSAYLESVAAVLRRIYIGDALVAPMVAAFGAHNLIEPATLEIEVGGGRRYKVPDCFTVSAERLAALDGPALTDLHSRDFLRCAIWLRSSLGNVAALIERKRRASDHP